MGIVLRQSVQNTVLTYAGFVMGAVNILFLYTRMMSETYFGLVGVVLSTAALLTPLLSVGVPNTLIKFFPGFAASGERDGFLSLMLLLPLAAILPVVLCTYLAETAIAAFLSRENSIVAGYVWHIFTVGMSMAYFEVFFAWSKICLKSAWGTFLKEVFVRLGATLLLLALYLGWFGVETFLWALVGLYLIRTVLMAGYALYLRPLRLTLQLPGTTREMLVYSSLILLGGSVSVILIEVDRFMINQYIRIENVAYYTVSVFIATVIIVPMRAMHQITYPITATLLHEGKMKELSDLYKRSSLGLMLVTLLIFLLILLNLEQLDALLPENYRGGFYIVLLIGAAKCIESFLGINSAILYNSPYYRTLLLMGVLLAGTTIALNTVFIPAWGITGAAVATFLAVAGYNAAKLVFVGVKYRMLPFSRGTWRVLLLSLVTGALFFRLEFGFHPVLNIVLKSVLVSVFYLGIALRLGVSEDLNSLVRQWLHRKNPGK